MFLQLVSKSIKAAKNINEGFQLHLELIRSKQVNNNNVNKGDNCSLVIRLPKHNLDYCRS